MRKKPMKFIQKEPVSDDERRKINKISQKEKLVSLFRKAKIFNWQAINKVLFKEYLEEIQSQKLHYDSSIGHYVKQ